MSKPRLHTVVCPDCYFTPEKDHSKCNHVFTSRYGFISRVELAQHKRADRMVDLITLIVEQARFTHSLLNDARMGRNASNITYLTGKLDTYRGLLLAMGLSHSDIDYTIVMADYIEGKPKHD